MTVQLEPEAQEFAEATANPPYLFDLGPEKGRKTVDEVQSRPIDKPDGGQSRTARSPAGPTGDVSGPHRAAARAHRRRCR